MRDTKLNNIQILNSVCSDAGLSQLTKTELKIKTIKMVTESKYRKKKKLFLFQVIVKTTFQILIVYIYEVK